MRVTAGQVRRAVTDAGIKTIDCNSCTFCNFMCRYLIDGDSVRYDSSCYCCRTNTPPRTRSWDDLANWVNMQSDDEIAAQIANQMGLTIARKDA